MSDTAPQPVKSTEQVFDIYQDGEYIESFIEAANEFTATIREKYNIPRRAE